MTQHQTKTKAILTFPEMGSKTTKSEMKEADVFLSGHCNISIGCKNVVLQ